MAKLSTTDELYYKIASQSPLKCKEVKTYYQKCLRVARYRKQPYKQFQVMLAILGKLQKKLEVPQLPINV